MTEAAVDPQAQDGPDRQAVEAAVRQMLVAVGEDPDREGLRDTPKRVARSYAEIFAGLNQDPRQHLETTFQTDTPGLVLVKDIEVHSMCEHHLLPFFGRVHVAYNPRDGRVTGLSKLARCVDGYARRPQIQERLTNQIAQALEDVLGATGVAVIVEAEHMCMTMRGVRKTGAETVTTAFRGDLDDPARRAEVLALVDK